MTLPHPTIIDPHSPQVAELIALLPESRGVYLFSIPEHAPHLGWSLNLRRRLTRLLIPSYTVPESQFTRYFQKFTRLSVWPAGSRLEASLLMYQITREHFPDDYLKRLRLRLPWLLALLTDDPFPRIEIINRPGRRHKVLYGPFLTRDLAQRYQQEIEGLFQVRRCTETLEPSPAHPGCIYGEMNQCLRPCQCAVSVDEYANEVVRVSEFLSTNGKTTLADLYTARERASSEMDFEQAAQLHKRLEKVKRGRGQPRYGDCAGGQVQWVSAGSRRRRAGMLSVAGGRGLLASAPELSVLGHGARRPIARSGTTRKVVGLSGLAA